MLSRSFDFDKCLERFSVHCDYAGCRAAQAFALPATPAYGDHPDQLEAYLEANGWFRILAADPHDQHRCRDHVDSDRHFAEHLIASARFRLDEMARHRDLMTRYRNTPAPSYPLRAELVGPPTTPGISTAAQSSLAGMLREPTARRVGQGWVRGYNWSWIRRSSCYTLPTVKYRTT